MKRVRVKPSKSASLMGLVVGFFLVCIGISTVSSFGLFGVVWTLGVLGITIMNGINFFSEKGTATHVFDLEEVSTNDSKHGLEDSNFDQKLRKLKKLKEDNIITEEEYQKKKSEILDERW